MNNMVVVTKSAGSELTHHGIKGQRWGVRRFQNQDGSLTAAGQKRYDSGSNGGNQSATKQNKSSKGKKIAKAVGITAAVVATPFIAKALNNAAPKIGSAIARSYIEKNFDKTLSTISKIGV